MTASSPGAAAFARERQARDTQPRFDLAELVRDLQAHEQVRGANHEWLQGYSAMTGGMYNATQPRIPVEALLNPRMRLDDLLYSRRDLTAGGAGTYLVPETSLPVIEALRPFSVTAQAGVETVIATGQGNLRYPVEASNATATWLADEAVSQIGESQPAVGETTASYHGLGVTLQISRQLMLQGGAGEWLRRSLMRSMARAIDAAVLAGSGVSGEPLGLANAAALIALTVDATNTVADLNDGIRHMRDAGLDQRTITWIAGPGAEETLRNREATATSGRFIWEGDRLLNMPAFGTPDAPTASLFVGPWQDMKLVLWGDLSVMVNPFSDFSRGLSALRVLVGVDLVIPQSGPFAYCETVS